MSSIVFALDQLGAINADRLEQFFPRVRDREDIAVLRDPESEVIVLSRSDHADRSYYEDRVEKETLTVQRQEVVSPRLEDDVRRARDFGSYICNRRWLDFGCGLGGMLDQLARDASAAYGLELNYERAAIVSRKGHRVVGAIEEVAPASLDVISLFHVLEHLTDPVGTLADLHTRLKPGGTLLVEVPHARDALITLYDCEPFKRFTFWSEHLALHTRRSLMLVLRAAGFVHNEITTCQRYPLSNHLHWLAQQRPGGHVAWRFLSSDALDHEYEAALSRIDRTDTLIAICRKADADFSESL